MTTPSNPVPAATDEPSPKSSETDPPAANQPLEDADLADASGSKPTSAGDEAPSPLESPVPSTRQVVPGKPDGEVDTRPGS